MLRIGRFMSSGGSETRFRTCRCGDCISTGPTPVDEQLLEEDCVTTRRQTKLVHEGEYVAEVDVELLESDSAWAPYLSLEEARKLDDVREALRRRDLTT